MERFERNIVAGCLVVIPLLITYWIMSTLLNALVALGRPLAVALASSLRPQAPEVADFLVSSQFEWIVAALLTLTMLYFLGALTTRMLGRRLLAAFDRIVGRIPFVQIFYGATRKLVATFQNAPPGEQRVVLIDFPSPEMKALGFVTRVFRAADTGQEVAAVYVPTTPVPTSGFIEIVPIHRLVWLDWSSHEAMQFIVSGGTVAPEELLYERRGQVAVRPVPEPAE
jgi:uncharacterized membrane protein